MVRWLLGFTIFFSQEIGGAYNGCTVGSDQFTISQSTNVLAVNVTASNDNCNVNAGSITAIGQYGTAPYEYQLTLTTDPAPTASTWAGAATNVFNVEGGDYVVYIKDANNCIQSSPITVVTDPEPVISAVVLTNVRLMKEVLLLRLPWITPVWVHMRSVLTEVPIQPSSLMSAGDNCYLQIKFW